MIPPAALEQVIVAPVRPMLDPGTPGHLGPGWTALVARPASIDRLDELRFDDDERFPRPRPTLGWAITQLVPSPGRITNTTAYGAALSWQVTPVLYSFALRPEVPPLRFFVVDPLARYGGSLEAFAAPGLAFGDASKGRIFFGRAGLRGYAPLAQRGDYLAASIGLSALLLGGKVHPALEAGMYTLFGVVGLEATVAPDGPGVATLASLRLRYF